MVATEHCLWLVIGPSTLSNALKWVCPGECLLCHWFSLATANLCSFLEYLLCAGLLLKVYLGLE